MSELKQAGVSLSLDTIETYNSALVAHSCGVIPFDNMTIESISPDMYRVTLDIFLKKTDVEITKLKIKA